MKIGSLYAVKKWYWFLFPSKGTAVEATVHIQADDASAAEDDAAATYWSRWFNCEVTWFEPDSYIVFLEEDGKYKKVLTSDGRIGWTCFNKEYNDSFEEANL